MEKNGKGGLGRAGRAGAGRGGAGRRAFSSGGRPAPCTVNDDHRADCAADDDADLQSEYLSDMWIVGCAPSSPYIAEHAELNASCFVFYLH